MSPAATIPAALLATAERDVGEYVFHLDGGVARLPCAELAERALRGARRLAALGVEPGDAVGVMGANRPEWVIGAFATWFAGAALVPVQVPLRIRDREAFREQLRRLAAAAGCERVLAEPRIADLLPPGVAVAWDKLGEESAEPPAAPDPNAAAVVQFTSGSTATPKGARISHAAAMAQIDLLRHAYRYADGRPRMILNWAPFFHDLGLFANVVQPAAIGATIHQLPTDRFARDPAEWLRLVGSTRAVITVAPSSAFGSAVRAVRRHGDAIDLSSLEAAFFAAEAVDPAVARRMIDAAEKGGFGLRSEALGSTYGLAEAVMAAAYSSPGDGLGIDRVSLPALAASGVATPAEGGPVRDLVSCGPPRTELRIAGPAGALGERQVGEIQLRGPSTMSGYLGEGVDGEHAFAGGWLRTGDLGYMADGELYVTGRVKDMVIAMGHNYYPEDFEWAAGRVTGVRPGRCVAFGLPNGEDVALLVEASDGAGARALAGEVRRTVGAAVGVRPAEVLVLPPGIIEKTSSGKLRRAAMRERYLSGALEPVPA